MNILCTSDWHSNMLTLGECLEAIKVGETAVVNNCDVRRVSMEGWRLCGENATDLNCYNIGEFLGKLMGMEYCPSCGMRIDGRQSLASLPASAFLGGTSHTFVKGEQKMKAFVKAVLPQGFHLSNGQLIPTDEAHDWIVEDD